MTVTAEPEERCELSDLPVSMCGHCRKVDLPKPTEGLVIRRFLVAKYDGRCILDDEHEIVEGDDIGQVVHRDDVDNHIGYACAVCVRAVTGG